MQTYRHGALLVMEEARPKDSIERALKAIDDRLFVERQVTLEGQAVWCVVCDVGGDHPPLTILEWRDSNDQPIHELSSGVIDRINRMERDGKRLTASVVKANAERLEKKKRETQAQWSELGTEFEKRMSPGYSAILPRGQHLRRSRDKMRNRGFRV